MGARRADVSKLVTPANCDRSQATLIVDEPADRIRLVSLARAKALRALGIESVRDLLGHFPRRYIDLSATSSIADAAIGSTFTIFANVHEVKLKRPKPRLSLVEIALTDTTGTLIVTAFRQPWLADQVKAGDTVAVAGKVEFDYGFKRMTNPFIEVIDASSSVSGGMIIPVHPACEKISAAWMRALVRNALDATAAAYDPLPLELRSKYRLMSRMRALRALHFPETLEERDQARRRIVYEEVFFLELMLMMQARERSRGMVPTAHVVDGPRMEALCAALPFSLTEDQARARDDVLSRMALSRCANHLVLGDVGTGKTVIAAFAVAAASDSCAQALFLAPTEVLARQHGASLGPLFDAAGITWDVLTGSTPAAQRAAILDRLAAGTLDVLLGTHAVLEDDVVFKHCTLVIIDEQQRFGVGQREKALSKGEAPDALYLTATPIPRTLALALFGDLTLSYLSQKPHDQARRETRVLKKDERGFAYDAAKEALARGEQVYVVCPLVGQPVSVEANDRDSSAAKALFEEQRYEYAAISIEADDDFSSDNISAATQEAAYLSRAVFADYRVELLHGKLSSQDKQDVMDRFSRNETHVLVATTVIEVGVDVPNATVMIVEDADRFGLSQLHQLRGRVGRGKAQGRVYLVSSSKTSAALERLSAMERTEDGFELAAYDLSLRREGDILGNRQHGASSLKLVNVVRDGAIIEAAHDDAWDLLEHDPHLEHDEHKVLAREVRAIWRGSARREGG